MKIWQRIQNFSWFLFLLIGMTAIMIYYMLSNMTGSFEDFVFILFVFMLCLLSTCFSKFFLKPSKNREHSVEDAKDMREHFFEIHGEETVEGGKSHWPDSIDIEMNRYHAWDMVRFLISQLSDEKREIIRYGTCGELTTDTE